MTAAWHRRKTRRDAADESGGIPVTPLEEHTALVAAVTEMLRVAEAVAMLDGPWTVQPHYAASPGCRCGSCYEDSPSGWEIPELEALRGHGAFPVFREEHEARFIAAHDPPLAILLWRHVLDVLNRHAPVYADEDDNQCAGCTHDNQSPWPCWNSWPCPEVSGLRPILLTGAPNA